MRWNSKLQPLRHPQFTFIITWWWSRSLFAEYAWFSLLLLLYPLRWHSMNLFVFCGVLFWFLHSLHSLSVCVISMFLCVFTSSLLRLYSRWMHSMKPQPPPPTQTKPGSVFSLEVVFSGCGVVVVCDVFLLAYHPPSMRCWQQRVGETKNAHTGRVVLRFTVWRTVFWVFYTITFQRPHPTLDELQCIFDRTFTRIVIDQANHVIISPTGSIVSHSIEGEGISKSVYFNAVSNYFCMTPKQSKKITA